MSHFHTEIELLIINFIFYLLTNIRDEYLFELTLKVWVVLV